MKHSGVFDRFKLRVAAAAVLALSIVMAGCAGDTAGSVTSEGTEIEQSAHTTIVLETVATEQPVTNTPTPSPTPIPTLTPEQRTVTVSFAGDCTLTQDYRASVNKFDATVGDDMEYCFKNCMDLFQNDDMTLVNLENPVTDRTSHKNNQYIFRMKPENLEMLTVAGIESVNIANNHTMDFLQEGLEDTRKNLDDHNIIWSDDKNGAIFTTSRGIKIGMVGLGNDTSASQVYKIIDKLREDGAAIVIASCHFGQEGVYEPTDRQKKVAHELIDYGVDIVVGTHPHRLQPIEKYNGHYIFYSLSNFCFGGNYSLSDPDSVIIQCDFIMDGSGTKCVDYRLRIYPYSQTSTRPGNDFCPKPYAWESEEYFRVMSRLNWAQGDE
ncbi:MAG: CapA family protein [Clostridiales bacterium]|nr:CapA family protein [Clostridiales bacterium]